MKELSLNILDIAKNSVRAGAKNIEIKLIEESNTLKVIIKDDGCGMDSETLKRVTDPFCTTRKTRKVGLGIPFYKLAAEQTGGSLKIISQTKESAKQSGTEVVALFYTDHIDFLPLGDIVSTVVTLIQGSPDIDFTFTHKKENTEISLDTQQMREVLQDTPLDAPEVLMWVSEFLNEQYKEK